MPACAHARWWKGVRRAVCWQAAVGCASWVGGSPAQDGAPPPLLFPACQPALRTSRPPPPGVRAVRPMDVEQMPDGSLLMSDDVPGVCAACPASRSWQRMACSTQRSTAVHPSACLRAEHTSSRFPAVPGGGNVYRISYRSAKTCHNAKTELNIGFTLQGTRERHGGSDVPVPAQ